MDPEAPRQTDAAADGPTRPSRQRMVVLVALAVLLVAVVAFAALALVAMDEPPMLTDEEARARVGSALLAGVAGLDGESTDGDLRQITTVLEARASDSAESSDGVESTVLQIDYGRDGVVRFWLHGPGDGEDGIRLICADRLYLVVGDERTLASRPKVVEQQGSCLTAPGSYGSLTSGAFGFSILEGLDVQDAAITHNDDGSVKADFHVAPGTDVVAELGAKGRIREIRTTLPGEDSTMLASSATFDYGKRSTIDLPDEFDLMPAAVELEETAQGGVHRWAVLASPEEPPLGDLEVQAWDIDVPYEGHTDAPREEGPGQPLATFDLADDRSQTLGNGTFLFLDSDDDGKLSAGDSFEIRTDAEEGPDSNATRFPYDVILYDRLAGGEVNSGFQMAPSPLWLVVAALAAVLAARRRRA